MVGEVGDLIGTWDSVFEVFDYLSNIVGDGEVGMVIFGPVGREVCYLGRVCISSPWGWEGRSEERIDSRRMWLGL